MTLNWFQLLPIYNFVFSLLYIYLQNVSYNSFWKNVVKILFWSAYSHMVCWSKLSNCSVMSNHMAWYLFSITFAEEHKPANGDIESFLNHCSFPSTNVKTFCSFVNLNLCAVLFMGFKNYQFLLTFWVLKCLKFWVQLQQFGHRQMIKKLINIKIWWAFRIWEMIKYHNHKP